MSHHEQPNEQPKKHPSRGRRFSAAEKALILEDAITLGVKSSAEKHPCSKWTIYAWVAKQKRVAAAQASTEDGGGATPEAETSPSTSTQDERHRLILELWRQQPGPGPSQIRGLLSARVAGPR